MTMAPTAGIAASHPACATNRAMATTKHTTRIPIISRYLRSRKAMSSDIGRFASVTSGTSARRVRLTILTPLRYAWSQKASKSAGMDSQKMPSARRRVRPRQPLQIRNAGSAGQRHGVREIGGQPGQQVADAARAADGQCPQHGPADEPRPRPEREGGEDVLTAAQPA